MKNNLKVISCVIFCLLFSLNVWWCNGETEDVGAIMEKTEKEALYYAIQGFVGSLWNGSDLYPDPCGWTPIQVCVFFSSYFVTNFFFFFGYIA